MVSCRSARPARARGAAPRQAPVAGARPAPVARLPLRHDGLVLVLPARGGAAALLEDRARRGRRAAPRLHATRGASAASGFRTTRRTSRRSRCSDSIPWRACLPPASSRAHLARRKAPLKAVLLDQSLFAGVGNWIADEVLYQARLEPAAAGVVPEPGRGAAPPRPAPRHHRARRGRERGQRSLPSFVAVPPEVGAARGHHHRPRGGDHPRDDRRPDHGLGSNSPTVTSSER